MNQKEFYESLPKKRVAAGALLFNEQGELLIVNPTYKDSWEIPGGCVEHNESPLAGCQRELREELGIEVKISKLLCVDYVCPEPEVTEGLQFIFTGPSLTLKQIEQIVLPEEELSDFKFILPTSAGTYLGPRLRDRVDLLLKNLQVGGAIYMESAQVPYAKAN